MGTLLVLRCLVSLIPLVPDRLSRILSRRLGHSEQAVLIRHQFIRDVIREWNNDVIVFCSPRVPLWRHLYATLIGRFCAQVSYGKGMRWGICIKWERETEWIGERGRDREGCNADRSSVVDFNHRRVASIHASPDTPRAPTISSLRTLFRFHVSLDLPACVARVRPKRRRQHEFPRFN